MRCLAERLEKAINLIANDDTVSPETLEIFLCSLLSAAGQLRRRLEAIRTQALEARESNPQTC